MTVVLPIDRACPVEGEVTDMVETVETEAVLATDIEVLIEEAPVVAVVLTAHVLLLIAALVRGPVCPVAVIPLLL